MLRTPPPRGRAGSAVLLAAVMFIALLAGPAAAEGHLTLTASERVTGRNPLVVSVGGDNVPDGPVTLTVRDDADAEAVFRLRGEDLADGASVAVDLALPDAGSEPSNGLAAVQLSRPSGVLAQTETVIDRSPPAPRLAAIVRGLRVGLSWEPVAAGDAVVYRLEKVGAGSDWAVLAEGAEVMGYTDRGLDPGRYRYRLTAAVPSADGDGSNWSRPSAVQVRIAVPESPSPEPSPTAPQSPPAATPSPSEQPAAAPGGERPQRPRAQAPRQRPRDVTASGRVRGPVDPAPAAATPQLETSSTPLVAAAAEPAVDGSQPEQPSAADPAGGIATPEVAAPAPTAPPVETPTFEARPPIVPVPPPVPVGSTLAVQAAEHAPTDPVTLGAGVVFLILAAAVVDRVRSRHPVPNPLRALRRVTPGSAARR